MQDLIETNDWAVAWLKEEQPQLADKLKAQLDRGIITPIGYVVRVQDCWNEAGRPKSTFQKHAEEATGQQFT